MRNTEDLRLELLKQVDIPESVNAGLTVASPQLMTDLFGSPRRSYTHQCQGVTNNALRPMMSTEDLGPFRANGLRPAVQSLAEILTDIAIEQPVIVDNLGTIGMLCCRYMRNGKKVSNHSWGTAIDLLICGSLDPPGNGKAYYALTLIAPIFNRHGWYWGGRFRGWEDAMHFEVSKEKLMKWQRAGLLGPVSKTRPQVISPPVGLSRQISPRRGDKGHKVLALQQALIVRGYILATDGDFGRNTEAAVVDFQRKHGLIPTGTVDVKTALYLSMF